MLLYLIKTIIPIIVLFIVNRIVLGISLKGVSEEKIIRASIILTGIISILYIFSCGNIEGFEEVENAETAGQTAQIEENVEEDLQELLNTIMEKDDTKEDIIEDGPKPSVNESIVTTEGTSGQEQDIEGSKDIAVKQPHVEETADVMPMPTKLEDRPTSRSLAEQQAVATNIDKEFPQKIEQPKQLTEQQVQQKYTILPIDQWMKPDAVDIINATSCSCPTVAPWGGAPMNYY